MERGKLVKWGMVGTVLFLSACSVSRYVPEGSYYVDEVKVISHNSNFTPSMVKSSIRQTPNSKTLGLARWPMYVYCLSGKKNTYVNRTLKKMGEAPVVYNEMETQLTCANMQQTLVNQGYLKAQVSPSLETKHKRAKITYFVDTKGVYRIRSIAYQCLDSLLRKTVEADSAHSLLHVNMKFDANVLNKERARIADNLHTQGYYSFRKEYVTFMADTARNSRDVNLVVRLRTGAVRVPDSTLMPAEASAGTYPSRAERRGTIRAPRYRIDRIHYVANAGSYQQENDDLLGLDSMQWNNYSFYYQNQLFLRPSLLVYHSQLEPGMMYDASKVKSTYSSFSRLEALKYTTINFKETSDSTLDCHIVFAPAKKMYTSFELEGTNTAGDLGVSAGFSFINRNLFHGSEVLTVKLRGAYETITQLQDYSGDHYIEYGTDVSLHFPDMIVPFLSDDFRRRSKASTLFDFQYNAQDRPEFDRRVLSLSWSYLWNTRNRVQHRYDVLGTNFVSVPKKDKFFIENYLNEYNSRNSILKYNYEDLLILRTGYSFYYSSLRGNFSKSAFRTSYTLRGSVETAGNILQLLSNALNQKKDSLGQFRLANIAYAQYVKGDLAWTANMSIDRNNALVFHAGVGIAYPYGNAKMLPFEKRYYAGGANSVRGWSVRGLGPGSYVSRNGTIDYINQSGDLKLDLNFEYRMHLLWKLDGAFFVDAGNIWTLYAYDDQPGGQFNTSDFYKQIAVAYGFGLRFDFDFVVLRLDGGMKAINPAFSEGKERYPFSHPRFGRDFAWHFAVGYPF